MSKIIGLMANNIKRLKAIEITPTGNMVELRGKNGAGKSAIIDAIFSALTAARLKDPIRHGEERADVEVNMGDFIVKKKWTEKGEAIQVYSISEDGKKITHNSPQTFLNEKIGALSFDPLSFQRMKSKERVELLKDIVGLSFDDIDKDRESVYTERAALNSLIKESIAHLKNTEAPHPDTPDEEVSYKAELDKIQVLRDKRSAFLEKNEEQSGYERMLKASHDTIGDLKQQIVELQDSIREEEKQVARVTASLNAVKIPDVITPEQIIAAESTLEDIEKKNAEIRAAKRYREAIRKADKLRKDSDALTAKLQRLDQDKATRIANAQFPIEGLRFTDDEVVYNDTNFDGLSTGEQIRVSTAIGMALNPNIKVIFIREGALLDKNNLQYIADAAKEKDYQVWVEICTDEAAGNVGFFIENGEIKPVEGSNTDSAIEHCS